MPDRFTGTPPETKVKRSKMMTFTYYQDPGHGWIKVPRKLLVDLDILNEISGCSYQYGQDVYLEEDCDAGHFFKAYVAKHGSKPKINSKHTDKQSRIRNYQSFKLHCPPVTTVEIGLEVGCYGKKYTVTSNSNRNKCAVRCNETGNNYTAKVAELYYWKNTLQS